MNNIKIFHDAFWAHGQIKLGCIQLPPGFISLEDNVIVVVVADASGISEVCWG